MKSGNARPTGEEYKRYIDLMDSGREMFLYLASYEGNAGGKLKELLTRSHFHIISRDDLKTFTERNIFLIPDHIKSILAGGQSDE